MFFPVDENRVWPDKQLKMKITKRGQALARQLAKYYPRKQATLREEQLCSVIARHARTHARLQERACSVEMTEKQAALHDKRDSQIEERIAALVAELPATKNGKITVRFGGDPRGFTVKLVVPNAERDGNTWGLGGEYGV